MEFFKYEDYIQKVNSIYDHLSGEIGQVLFDFDIHHIGSSSIPGSVSKGDLDVLIRVPSVLFEDSISLIKSLGYKEKTESLRTHELCMLVTEKYNHDVAIQLIVRGSAFEMFLKFRDILRENADLVSEYNQLKISSVDLDVDSYRAKKSKFIEKVLAR